MVKEVPGWLVVPSSRQWQTKVATPSMSWRSSVNGVSMTLGPGVTGLLGPNGAGKSTLVKALAGTMPLARGERHVAQNLAIGYFAQHQLEQLDGEATPLLHLQRIEPGTRDQALRDFLGGFDFRGDMVTAPVARFSGGEKARLVLAMIVRQRPQLLILDEPTNHLDIEMREALAEALQDFDGALMELVRRPGIVPVLVFILIFKLPDAAMGFMVKPFWVDAGFTAAQIGLVSVNIGLALSIARAYFHSYSSHSSSLATTACSGTSPASMPACTLPRWSWSWPASPPPSTAR